MVTLADFAFGSEPVFGFVAGLKSSALRQEVSEAADFVFKIDWHEVGARLGFDNLRLGRGSLANGLLGSTIGGSAVSIGFRYKNFGRSSLDGRYAGIIASFFWDSGFCHIAYSLKTPKI
jgi:hypothetical protein